MIESKEPVFLVGRHEDAKYQLNFKVLQSANPEDPVSAANQDFDSDLSEPGKERGRMAAKNFFEGLESRKDDVAFFFLASDFVRAIETADIYRQEAEEKGFQVIYPKNPSDPIVQRVGQGKIRHLDALSLKIDNGLLDQIFSPSKDFLMLSMDRGIEFPPEFIVRWRKARRLIEGNNGGTWSENFKQHYKEVKELLPEIKKAHDKFIKQFGELTRLMSFGKKKIEEANYGKQIYVMAFTHENLFTHWLGEFWKEPGLEKGEIITFSFDPEKNLHASLRGKDKIVTEEQKKYIP